MNIATVKNKIKSSAPAIAIAATITTVGVVVYYRHKLNANVLLEVNDNAWEMLASGGALVYMTNGVELVVATSEALKNAIPR